MKQLRTLRKWYRKVLDCEDEDLAYQGFNEIAEEFWQLKKMRREFEDYIGTEDCPRRINPNPYDTPTYWLMKPSEQANVEGMFMDKVLGKGAR